MLSVISGENWQSPPMIRAFWLSEQHLLIYYIAQGLTLEIAS
jgi:hypothetical protein